MATQREELEKALQKIKLKEQSGLEVSSDEYIQMLILASEPLALDDPVYTMSKEQLDDIDRTQYSKKFLRMIPKEYNPWTVLSSMLSDMENVLNEVERIADSSEYTKVQKRVAYLKQEERLWVWFQMFGTIVQVIITNAEICEDENEELAEDFLITGSTEEFEKQVAAWTDSLYDKEDEGIFTFDDYYRTGSDFQSFYRYLHRLFSHTVEKRSEDEIYYYHISMLLLLIAFRSDIMMNKKLKNEKYKEMTKPPYEC